MITYAEAAALLCSLCRSGDKAELLAGTRHFFHGNPFNRCEATPIWAAEAGI